VTGVVSIRMEPQPQSARPPGGPGPPAPPGVADPGGRPDPSDAGPPIGVLLGAMPLGDLGNPRVDSRLVVAVLLRDGEVSRWLRFHNIDVEAVQAEFTGASWPLQPSLGQPGKSEPDPCDLRADLDIWLDDMHLGRLGEASTDARVLNAILLRGWGVGSWLQASGITIDAVETAFPGSSWY